MSQEFSMTPIAHIHSDFAEKFGVPRQSGLVSALRADCPDSTIVGTVLPKTGHTLEIV